MSYMTRPKRGLWTGILLLAAIAMIAGCQASDTREAVVSERWHYGRTLYEIYPRAFSAEGDLNAITGRLDELQQLGVQHLWLMPIHPVGEKGRKGTAGSPYSVRDYFAIGEEYGSKEDFRRLVTEAHDRGMKVIMDMVMNHSANDHILMDEHPGWYAQDSTGAFTREVADWSDITDWNYDHPEVHDYLTRVLLYWVEEFDVDGYRCDVAGLVPDEFWLTAIDTLREVKPNVFMLAEWEDEHILELGFDAAYDWTLYHRLKDHHKGTVGLDSLWHVIETRQRIYPDHALPLRFVENHDEPRSAGVFGWPGAKPYAALIFTLPGIPLIYSGQEVGATHKPSLFQDEPIDWDREEARQVRTFYETLVELRGHHSSLRAGNLQRVKVTAPELLVFTRHHDGETAMVAINFADEARTFSIPAQFAGHVWAPVAPRSEQGTATTLEQAELAPGEYRVWIGTAGS